MNALQYAVNMIKHQIPQEVLQVAFNIDENASTVNLTSLDEKILRKCIRNRVMIDANVVGGVELTIPLNQVTPAFFEDTYTVYFIPPELTMNREIISVLGLTSLPFGSGYNGNIPSSGGGHAAPYSMSPTINSNYNAVMNVADRIGDAAAISGIFHNAHTEIVGYNTVAVYSYYRTLAMLGLRVVIENDNNLNNIQPRSYNVLGTLCSLAVKAYIYNKLSIAINNGYLSGGQDLGMFKNIVDSYSQAEEDYQVYLREKWAKVAFMNDNVRHTRQIISMISPDL